MPDAFHQPERNHRHVHPIAMGDYLSLLKDQAKEHGLAVADVIAAHRVLQLQRQNDLYAANGDIFDEQVATFAQLLQSIAHTLEDRAS